MKNTKQPNLSRQNGLFRGALQLISLSLLFAVSFSLSALASQSSHTVGGEALLDQDRAVIQVAPNSGQEVLRLRPGAVLFSDRKYRLNGVPSWLYGEKFLRGSIQNSRVEVLQSGLLLALTPLPQEGATSMLQELEASGFHRLSEPAFQLFGIDEINKVIVLAKKVSAGEVYTFGKYAIISGFEEVSGALDQSLALKDKSWLVYPEDIPNTGYLLVDQEKDGRSGHGGITLTEASNGDILAFYSVTWAEKWMGHSVSGWSKYKRSSDGGLTWSAPIDFAPSKKIWEDGKVHSGLVFSVITAPDGTLIATMMRYANYGWQKQLAPIYYLSHDHGVTWQGPHQFDESATVDTLSMTLSTHFVRDGEVFIVFRGGRSNMAPGGRQTLWVSKDNGKSFQERSVLPFDDVDYYWAAEALDDGSIVVYTYNAHAQEKEARADAEKSIRYTISRDGGYTWSPLTTTYFAKGIRNMQMSAKLGDYYYMQGRSGSYGRRLEGDDPGPGSFVLYASTDGINWDEGTVLVNRQQTPGAGDHYSSNAIVGKYDPKSAERLMILADISYNGPRTNMHYWWVTSEEQPEFSLENNPVYRKTVTVDPVSNGIHLLPGDSGLGAALAEEK